MEMSSKRAGWPESSPWKGRWHLSPDVVFLNHGSFGACPRDVLDFQTKLREQMESGPIQFLAKTYGERLDAARNQLAVFLGAKSENLVFVNSATTAVNAVARSLVFQPGDEILTTDQDYNACRNVLIQAAERSGAKVIVAKIPMPVEDAFHVTAAILAAVTPRTRLAMIDHVTSNTGMIFPIEEIVRGLEARGVDTLVDGAHAPGMLQLDLEKLNCAYYTGNLHKWACAPKGAAFLWVKPERQDGVQPAVISHGSNVSRAGHNALQDRFDWPATHDPTAWFSSVEAIRWLGDFLPGGWDELRAGNHRMVVEARRMLCERLGVFPICPEEMIGSMATLPMPEPLDTLDILNSPDPLYRELFEDHGIELQVVTLAGRRGFRISSHLHNSPDEYRYLEDILTGMVARARK